MSDWIRCADKLPEQKVEVMTKIDDENGPRNEQSLKMTQRGPEFRPLWWQPDMSMYVYYTPTHWRSLP